MNTALPAAEAEVADLCQELIRIDSSNYGDGTGPGEGAAAEYVQARLSEVGLEAERFVCGPGREGVAARIPGTDPTRGALLVHGHIDVVPARADDWSRPPFAAEVDDDLGEAMVWGRGAVDMKDMDAMILATVRAWQREGIRPERDIQLLFLPDEEAGGRFGSGWLVDNRRDLFDGVTEAVGEVGGFSLTINDDLRLYLIQTAEKGMQWMKVTAQGQAGHGSMINDDNAVTRLCEAVARVGAYEFPIHVTPSVRSFFAAMSDASGIDLDPNEPEQALAKLGGLARIVGSTLRNTVNPTMLSSGYKVNVIPGEASAHLDGRFLPGYEDEMTTTVGELLGSGIEIEMINNDIALETTFDGPSVDLMAQVLRAEDPGAVTVPYMVSGGTDAKAFSRLGIRCFGFSPLRLPPDLDFAALFHGVDERVPVASLQFGTRVLNRFLQAC